MNAKVEFLSHISQYGKVKCAKIKHIPIPDPEFPIIILKIGYSQAEWNEFLMDLDYNYDDTYGCQELYGTIWFEDGTWSSRGEYDGSEWWEHNKLPEIPKELL